METQETVTPEEAARLLGVSVNTIRTAIRTKTLEAKPPVGLRIPMEALEAYRRRTQPDGYPKVGRPRKQEAACNQ